MKRISEVLVEISSSPSGLPESVRRTIDNATSQQCLFCASPDVLVPQIGIAFGMSGADYSFCAACLSGMSAADFWRLMFLAHDYDWPPVPLSDG